MFGGREVKCEYCGEGKASAIIFDEDDCRFKYICDACLCELVRVFGEINLEFEYLFNRYLVIDWLKRKANMEIEYRENKLEKFRKHG